MCFCGRDCRALRSSRVPLGRGEQAQEKPEGARAGCARVRREHRDVLPANPGACSRSHARMDARVTADARVSFLWLLSFGQAKERNRPPWMADEKHTDVSRLSRERRKKMKSIRASARSVVPRSPSPYPLPQAGEGKKQSGRHDAGRQSSKRKRRTEKPKIKTQTKIRTYTEPLPAPTTATARSNLPSRIPARCSCRCVSAARRCTARSPDRCRGSSRADA